MELIKPLPQKHEVKMSVSPTLTMPKLANRRLAREWKTVTAISTFIAGNNTAVHCAPNAMN